MENSTQKTEKEILDFARPHIKSVIATDGEVYTDREVLERIHDIIAKAGGAHTSAYKFVSQIDTVTEGEGSILDDFIDAYLKPPASTIEMEEIVTLLNQVQHQLFVVMGRKSGCDDNIYFIDAENVQAAKIKATLLIAENEDMELGTDDIYIEICQTLTEYLQAGIVQ